MSPIDDTPAAKAGIQSGDLIYALDGEPVQGLTLQEAVEKMRGKAGTPIKISIRRAGKDPRRWRCRPVPRPTTRNVVAHDQRELEGKRGMKEALPHRHFNRIDARGAHLNQRF